MNAEQKQRAMQMLRRFSQANPRTLHADNAAVDMAALLQELIDAPEAEPVAKTTGYYVGHLTISTVDGRVLPAGTALYAAPPHQSEHHLEMVNTPAPSVPVEPMENIALNEWLDKTEWMQKEINTFPVSSLGMHRADVMRLEIERLRKLLSAAPTPAEAPADVARDAERWLSEHDLELLVTFGMQADDCDADGHTLSKEQTRRLCELGVLRNVGFGRHEMTAFGDSIFGVYFSQGISLPLQTHAEYNAAIEREKMKGGEA